MKSELEYLADAKKILADQKCYEAMDEENKISRTMELIDKIVPIGLANHLKAYNKLPGKGDFVYVVNCNNMGVEIDLSKYIDPDFLEFYGLSGIANRVQDQYDFGVYGDKEKIFTLYFRKK